MALWMGFSVQFWNRLLTQAETKAFFSKNQSDHIFFKKKKKLTTTNLPKCDPQGMIGGHNQNSVQYVVHLSLLSKCAKCGIKFFKIVLLIELYCYFTFWPLHRAHGVGGWGGLWTEIFNCLIFYSLSCLIWYVTWLCFEKLDFWPLPIPLSVIPRAWPSSHNQNPVQYVINLSLLSICAKCSIKIL